MFLLYRFHGDLEMELSLVAVLANLTAVGILSSFRCCLPLKIYIFYFLLSEFALQTFDSHSCCLLLKRV